MKELIAIRHVPFEDLGSWEAEFQKSGFKVTYLDAGIDDLTRLKQKQIDLLVVCGGPLGAYEEEEYPFIIDEINLLEKRLREDLPTIGLCLGAQLIARALGARVYPNGIKEIGWSPLMLTDAGKKSPINHLDGSFTSMFHWHGDTFDLPKESTLLASTTVCKNQIYTWGKQTIAFQCHPEALESRLEQWWIGHANELNSQKLSPKKLRQETAHHISTLQKQSQKCLKEWLQHANKI